MEREKKDFLNSASIIKAQDKLLESKTWWLVRDNFRGQAYNMKANMLALNKVQDEKTKPLADKAYAKFVKQLYALDLACVKKEYDLAVKEYTELVANLDAWIAIVI